MFSEGQQKIAIDKIVESPTNPRKTFRKIEELAESIRSVGLLQAIIVRPVGTNGSARAEIVFGHRRYRAAKLAGVDEVLCDVRAMTDKQVLEAQLVENVQRDDVEVLEEADGYRTLIDEHGYTPDDLAVKIGKSKAFVYGRLKLCALGPEGRAALAAGTLTPSTALLIARIPATLQADAVEELQPYQHDPDHAEGDPIGAREAFRRINGKFMLRLADAPFAIDDAKLVPAAGACTACPKRTGNQPELFADVKVTDTCTDPTCFAEKRDAGWVVTKTAAVKAGRTVLDSKKDVKDLFPHGEHLAYNSGYVDLNARDFTTGGNKTFRDRYGKKIPETAIVLARDGDGKVHELVDAKLVKKLEPKASAPEREADAGPTVKESKADAEAREQLGAEKAAAGAIVGALVANVAKKELDAAAWKALIEYVRPMSHLERVLERRGHLAKAGDDLDKAEKAFDVELVKMPAPGLRGVFVELLVTDRSMLAGPDTDFGRLAKAMKVDTKAIVAKERARLKTEAKSKAKGK